MPTYSYKCPACGHEYTRFQKITDTSRAKCPRCATRGERVITGGGGLIFKGSGFYITDYKRAGTAAGKEGAAEGAESKEKPANADKVHAQSGGRTKASTKSKGADS